MSVIAEFSIPASQFLLGRALQAAPSLEIELERVVPAGESAIPYIWVTGEGRDEFDDVLDDEPGLTAFEPLDTIDNRTLYRLEWDQSADTFLQTVFTHDATLLTANGDNESWLFQLRFDDSHDLSEFHTACGNGDLDMSVERLYNPIEPTMMDTRDLTDAQRNLIERAYDEGYFDVPRGITLVELASSLGISDQAVNERLRRGLKSLIATTLKSGDSQAD